MLIFCMLYFTLKCVKQKIRALDLEATGTDQFLFSFVLPQKFGSERDNRDCVVARESLRIRGIKRRV